MSEWLRHRQRCEVTTLAPKTSKSDLDIGDAIHTGLRVAASVGLAALIFLADMLSGAKGTAGVLYVPLMVAIATEARRREVMAFGLLGAAFALAAFLIARHHAPDRVVVWPLGVGLVSVAVSSALLSRLVASREALIGVNHALAYSEWRYRSIFERSRFPFWERDFSATLALYERLKAEGVTNLLEHYRGCPELYERIGRSIVILDFNHAMMCLVGATSRADFPKNIAEMKVNPITMMLTQQSIFDGTRLLDGRSSLTTVDGVVKDIWVAGEISRDPGREGIMVGFLIDLTERERAQRVLASARAELARATRVATVGALSVSIAHEINQPLAAAIMNAQTCVRYLRRSPPDLPAAIIAAERATHEVGRAGDIVRRTRDLATNRTKPEESVDLGRLIREALSLLDHDIRDAGVEVEFDPPSHAVELLVDRVAFQQVLVNLIGNAVQAMKEMPISQRRLTVDLRQDAAVTVFEVRDTGPGIADGHVDRLFEPFFTTREGGVGIGLAISRSAVEARGGHLRAFNRASGGAVFECRIPISRDDVA
jgi:signal transduction histidine kinase